MIQNFRFLFILYLVILTYLQVHSQESPDRYNRATLTVLLANCKGDKYKKELTKVFVEHPPNLPFKFFPHQIEIDTVEIPLPRLIYSDSEYDYVNKFLPQMSKVIYDRLFKKQVGKQILSKWWGRNSSGEFDLSLIAERGKYNAPDFEWELSENTIAGVNRIKEQGVELVDNSYVLVLDFAEFSTVTKDSKPGYRELIGNPVYGWLYKLDFNSLKSIFFEDMWVDTETSKADAALRIDAYDSWQVHLIPLGKYKVNTSADVSLSSQQSFDILMPNTENKLAQLANQKLAEWRVEETLKLKDQIPIVFNQAFNLMIEKVMRQVSAFRVKASILSADDPTFVSARIGQKESVTPERRYFVYEFIQREGRKELQLVGAMRAHTVGNNLDSRGISSVFYQYAGKPLGRGMLVEERNDIGIRISSGFKQFGGPKAQIRASYLIGKQLELPEKLQPGLEAFIGAYIDLAPKVLNPNRNLQSDVKLSIGYWDVLVGVQKNIPFMSSITLAPFAGLGLSLQNFSANSSAQSSSAIDIDSDLSLNSIFVEAGGRIQYQPHPTFSLSSGLSLGLGLPSGAELPSITDREVSERLQDHYKRNGLFRIGIELSTSIFF